VHHVTIAFVGGYLVVSGNYKKVRSLSFMAVFTALLVLAHPINALLGTNFVFVNPDKVVEPITTFRAVLGGNAVYIIIAGIYSAVVAIDVGFRVAAVVLAKVKTKTIADIIRESDIVPFVKNLNLFDVEEIRATLAKHLSAVNARIKSKALRKVINASVRLIKLIRNSGLLKRLVNSPLGDVTDMDYLKKELDGSGLLVGIAKEFKFKELKELKELKKARKAARSAEPSALPV
jgi:hypothetical protein